MKMKSAFVVLGSIILASCGDTPIPQEIKDVQRQVVNYSNEERETAAKTIFSLSDAEARSIEAQIVNIADIQDRESKVISLLLNRAEQLSVQQAYMIFGQQVTRAEIDLCAWAASTCLTTYLLANEASSAATTAFQDHGIWGGRTDAYRHGYWNALMTSQINESWAQQYANAHESEAPAGPDRDMDLHNNQVGRNIGRYYGPGEAAKMSLRSEIYNAVISGRTYGFCGSHNSYSNGYLYKPGIGTSVAIGTESIDEESQNNTT